MLWANWAHWITHFILVLSHENLFSQLHIWVEPDYKPVEWLIIEHCLKHNNWVVFQIKVGLHVQVSTVPDVRPELSNIAEQLNKHF